MKDWYFRIKDDVNNDVYKISEYDHTRTSGYNMFFTNIETGEQIIRKSWDMDPLSIEDLRNHKIRKLLSRWIG